MGRNSRIATAALAATAWGLLCFWGGMTVAREPAPAPKVEVLLSTDKTIIGQPIRYPTQAPAKVTAAIVTMQPGQSTGWHKHDVPLIGYMLAGEITVDYGPKYGKKVYGKGATLAEAIHEPHDGTATSAGPASILVVFAGAEGIKNSDTAASPY
ncbi:MAG: cupin domain-containing protein [Alphaproteobacteria bacterium]|nr:cupin domain-containing protein [Alphaproteobacteria bacterium]